MNKITTNLMVSDVNETIKYYEDNLDFKLIVAVDDKKEIVTEDSNGRKLTWAMIKNGDVEINLQRKYDFISELPDLKNYPIGGSFALYINMKDVKGFYNKVQSKVDIVKEIYQTFFEADEFIIRDLNGYMIYFSEI